MESDEFEAALQTQEVIVVAWNTDNEGERRTAIVYSVGVEGHRALAERAYPESEWASARDALSQRGFRQGHFDNWSTTVWTTEGGKIDVWNGYMQLLSAREGVITSHGCDPVQYDDVARIVAYIDPDDGVERGLNLELADGQVANCVFEISTAASLMMDYDHNERIFDTAWLIAVGSALSVEIGVPMADQICPS